MNLINKTSRLQNLPPYLSQNLTRVVAVLINLILLLTTCTSVAQTDEDDDLLIMMPPMLAAAKNQSNSPTSPSLCQGFDVNDRRNRPMQAMSRPEPGASYTDAAFGGKITRISNSAGLPSGIIRTLYSTIQSWNSDESLMILWHRGQGHYLYDGTSYQLIGALAITPSDIEQIFWSTSNPNLFYYPNKAIGQTVATEQGGYRLQGNELMSYNVSTEQYQVIKDFNANCPSSQVTGGNDVQMISYDDDVFGFRCGDNGFSYRQSSDTITSLPSSANSLAPQAFPSGGKFFHNGFILNQQLQTLRRLDLGNASEHSSLGRLHNGNDAYFAIAFDPNQNNSCGDGIGSVVVHDANDASCRVLVGPSNDYPYSLSGTHISALATQRPGWAVVSSVGYGIEGDSLLEQELYLVNTDPAKPEVCRIAHHRSTGRRGSIGYFAEPHPVLSPSGTRVLFNSDWNNSGSVDAYVLELDSHKAN